MRPKKHCPKRLLTIAAVLAALMAVTVFAAATDLFGLHALLLPERAGSPLQAEDTDSQITNTISLAGYSNTPEWQATAEWQSFLNSYDKDGKIISVIGNDIFSPGSKYTYYQVYTQEMADKLDEIAAKYQLKLHTDIIDDLYTNEALCQQVGGDFLGENQAYGAYMYEDGTFKFDGEIDLSGYGMLDYQFMRCVRGSFADVLLHIGNITDYTEWSYTTVSGIPVTLALSAHKALLIADLSDSFVTVNILAGTQTQENDLFSSGALTQAPLEHFADSFDFSLLDPVQPPKLSAADPEPYIPENSDGFTMQTGIEEADAQAFYAKFLHLLERDDRLAVAESIHYPACVTILRASGTGTRTEEFLVTSAEEFLPYYDDIFTDGLWESIKKDQFIAERADLITDNGMIGAANGAIWFVPMEDDLTIITIQNDEGCSIRQSNSGITAG